MANNQIQVKRTSTAGRTPNTTGSYATNSQYISPGELALNMTDQILYTSNGTSLIYVGANVVTQYVTNNLIVNTGTSNVSVNGSYISVNGTVFANTTYLYASNGLFLSPQTSVAPNTSEGSIFYDVTNHALNFYTDDPSTSIEVGQQQIFRAVNKTGATIPFGSAVYISGAQGNRPTVNLAIANSASFYNIAGFVLNSAGIVNNAEGNIITNGLLQGINTSAFTTGAVVYLSATTPGAITTTEPTYPNYNIAVGQALNSTNNGKVYVNIVPNYLAGIPNTAISISNGTLLTYSNNFLFDYANNVLHIGNTTANVSVGYINAAGSFSFLQILNNGNTSVEESLSNLSSGTNASSDMIVYDSSGLLSSNYLDMGINSNGYSQSTWTINGPSEIGRAHV